MYVNFGLAAIFASSGVFSSSSTGFVQMLLA
jgi:hypothetical protein